MADKRNPKAVYGTPVALVGRDGSVGAVFTPRLSPATITELLADRAWARDAALRVTRKAAA
jgi:hypothetical protein